MYKYILLVLGLFAFSTVFAKEYDYSIVNYRASNNNFIINAPSDLKLDKTVVDKEKRMFAIYKSDKAKYFNFMIIDKQHYQVGDDVYKSIDNIYNDLFTNIPYEFKSKSLFTRDNLPSAVRYLLKYKKSSSKHFLHLIFVEGKSVYYCIQIRDTQETLPKWLSISDCEKHVCDKVENQRILSVPNVFN